MEKFLKIFLIPCSAKGLPENNSPGCFSDERLSKNHQSLPCTRATSQPGGQHGNRQLHFSIPDTAFLGINCPDAWVLRPQRCPVKTHWVARREARERRMIPAEQPFQRTGCHQKSQKASVLSLLSLGDWHLSACAQRSSTSGTVSIPGRMWGQGPVRKTLSKHRCSSLSPFPCLGDLAMNQNLFGLQSLLTPLGKMTPFTQMP